MIILVNCKISPSTIASSLGKAEYSYYFLLKEFLPALHQLGTVIEVDSLADVDRLYDEHRETQPVIFLSVSPPHQTPVDLRCPTVCMFAWEYYNIPNRAWDNEPRNDWRYVFAHIAGAIACSEESAQAVRDAMGQDYPVIALPAPLFERFQPLSKTQGWLPRQPDRSFEFTGFMYDSPQLGLSADGLVQHMERPQPEVLKQKTVVTPRKSTWQITKEHWQAWRAAAAKNKQNSAHDNSSVISTEIPNNHYRIELTGTVYTTVLNPLDSRKNWYFIVVNFCWAFRDDPDTTLLIKATHHDLEAYRIELLTVLSRLAPFSCRVVLVHGFLTNEQYQQLINITDFYLNASSGEGLCLPLMEFLSSGKPVIAPMHSAMRDYLHPNCSFIIDSSIELCQWPHDPYGSFSTHRYRINWHSLMQQLQDSQQIAQHQPERYQHMSLAVAANMERFCNLQLITHKLSDFLISKVHAAQQKSTQAVSEAKL